MHGWNFADVWEAVAERFPDATAQRHAGRQFTWRDFDRRADGVAEALLASGLERQDKVAQFLYNGPEYLESMFGIFKAALVPLNTNYRYSDDELDYLWRDADVRAVLFHGSLTATCDRLRARLPEIRAWVHVDDGTEACPNWAVSYDGCVEATRAGARARAPWGRSGDDLFLLYTGGTTGMPKGVMWQQRDLFSFLETSNGRPPREMDPIAYVDAIERPGPRVLPAAPMMHGTATWFAMPILCRAGSVLTLASRHFDAFELLDATSEHRINGWAVVGDAFGRPVATALEADADRWSLDSMRVVFSSGAMMSAETKRTLLRHLPRAVVVDGLGTSESGFLGRSVTHRDDAVTTAVFEPGPVTRVIDENGQDVVPGSGERGRLAVSGHLPLGYYKDEEKTASVFVTIGGTRYAVAGDWAEVDADGRIRLLGRGSVCINSGGEKIFPEEVEEVLKRHPAVTDCVVVGVPDDRLGQAVAAVVETADGTPPDPPSLVDHVRATLARYKAPRRVVHVATIGRQANGKADYRRLSELAAAAVDGPDAPVDA